MRGYCASIDTDLTGDAAVWKSKAFSQLPPVGIGRGSRGQQPSYDAWAFKEGGVDERPSVIGAWEGRARRGGC